MATTTRAVLRQRLSEDIGDYNSLTASANGAAGGTTLVDSSLANLLGGTDDDAFIEQFVLITSGSADGEERRASTYAQSTTTITVQEAFSAQIVSGVTYELHRFSPTDKHNAINRALEQLFPSLYLPIRDETLVVDNVLLNADFENFTGGAADSWTLSGAGASQTAETSRIFHSEPSSTSPSSVKLDSAAAAAFLTQAPTVNVADQTDKQITFKMWVYTAAASVARLNLNFGVSTVNGNHHGGADEWELLEVTTTIPADATQIQAECEVATGTNTAYFDAGWMSIDPIHRLTIPTTITRGPNYVSQQALTSLVDGAYHPILNNWIPTQGQRLRLEGQGLLSRPTTDAGTTEIGDEFVDLVVEKAKENLWLIQASPARSAARQREFYLQQAQMAALEVARMLGTPGKTMPRMGAYLPRNSWHAEEDSDGRYLVFDRIRATGSRLVPGVTGWWVP